MLVRMRHQSITHDLQPPAREIELVRIPGSGIAGRGNGAVDAIGDALRDEGEAIAAAPLAHGFYDWYWPQIAPLPANRLEGAPTVRAQKQKPTPLLDWRSSPAAGAPVRPQRREVSEPGVLRRG